MKALLDNFQQNISFVVTCILIATGLFLAARAAEYFLPSKRGVSATQRITIIGVCSSIAAILHIFDFPLPFLAPGFYKLDFSEIPAMLCGLYLGPSAAVLCEIIKIILKLFLKGTATAFVGDFANFVVGCSFVLPASIIYHLRRTRTNAIIGLAAGTVFLTVFGTAFNAVYLLPKFASFMIPLDQIIAMGAAINPYINSITSFVLCSVAPLNLIKGFSVSVLTFLLYKRLPRPSLRN